MRIGLISSAVPLIQGGGRFIVDWLKLKLEAAGHQVCIVYIPSTDEPHTLLQQMTAFRMIALDEYFDRVVTFRPPSHMVRHRCKVVWFIHHVRGFYDLWDTPYRSAPDLAPWRAMRNTVMRADTAALSEARHLFTNSLQVGDRVRRFNGLDSRVLYPPVFDPALFRCEPHGTEIVCISRIEPHKRQLLLVEAMRHVRSPVTLRICGLSTNATYIEAMAATIREHGLEGRVVLENRWISEGEKADRLAGALAAAYVPLDEDSYGYPTVEAAHAGRCTLTLADAGGTLEFVQDGISGRVVPPEPAAIAAAFDALCEDRAATRRMGEAARARVDALGISWDHVVAQLLS